MSDPTEYTPTTEEVLSSYPLSDADKTAYPGLAWEKTITREGFDRWLVEHVRQVSERVHEDTVTVMAGLMPRGHTWLVPVNPYRKAVDE